MNCIGQPIITDASHIDKLGSVAAFYLAVLTGQLNTIYTSRWYSCCYSNSTNSVDRVAKNVVIKISANFDHFVFMVDFRGVFGQLLTIVKFITKFISY